MGTSIWFLGRRIRVQVPKGFRKNNIFKKPHLEKKIPFPTPFLVILFFHYSWLRFFMHWSYQIKNLPVVCQQGLQVNNARMCE